VRTTVSGARWPTTLRYSTKPPKLGRTHITGVRTTNGMSQRQLQLHAYRTLFMENPSLYRPLMQDLSRNYLQREKVSLG